MDDFTSKNYWDEVWRREREQGVARIYPEVHKWIASRLSGTEKLLDIGAGLPTFARRLCEVFPGLTAIAVDHSAEAVCAANEAGVSGLSGIEIDFPKDAVKVPGTYDLAIATEFLEHVEDDRGAVREMLRLAKRVIVSVPDDCLGPEEEPEHLRQYTADTLRDLFRDAKRLSITSVYEPSHGRRYLIADAWGEKRLPEIQVSVLNQGWIKPELATWLHRVTLAAAGRAEVSVTFPCERPIQHNRNRIVKDFLRTSRDWLVMVDCDVVPAGNVLDVIDRDPDVFGYPLPTLKCEEGIDLIWLVLDRAEGGYRPKRFDEKAGMIEVDAVGSGCMVVARRVLEAVRAPFSVQWDEDGLQEVGLDFRFCERAKEAGFKVWTDTRLLSQHFGDKGQLDFLALNNLLASIQDKRL